MVTTSLDSTSAPQPASPFALKLPLVRRGKVRDVYELPAGAGQPNRLLIVATDRISAFDVIMPTPIDGKGRTLTQMSSWWFDFITQRKLAETHVLSTSLSDVPESAAAQGSPARAWLDGRITIGRSCTVVPIECVARGYLEGSGWKEYQHNGTVCGVTLPSGLRQCDKLPEPIFTPATKAATGHDENITFEHACDLVGMETMHSLREITLAIYSAAAEHALSRGIIIADTKFEFGFPDDKVPRAGRIWVPPIIIDEVLTPDSSRFWPADTFQPGQAQRSFDKQFLREYLEGLTNAGKWDKSPPGPELPPEVVAGTKAKYDEALHRLCA